MKNLPTLSKLLIPLTLSLHFSASALTVTEDWSSAETYPKNSFVMHGDYQGNPLIWSSIRSTNKEPGESGSGWILENRHSRLSGLPYKWIGMNSNAPIRNVSVDNESGAITYSDAGTTGEQLDLYDFSSPVVPTWPEGSEGVYMIIHEGLGELNYETSVLPANEVSWEFPHIRPSWSVDVTQMDENEWNEAGMMLMDGHELLVQQPRLSPFKDQIETYGVGDTLVSKRAVPLIPELEGAVVSMTKEATKEQVFRIPSLCYPTNNLAEPDTVWKEITLQVSMNFGNTGTTISIPAEDSVGARKEVPFPGYIHPVSADMTLPLLIVPALTEVEAVRAAKLSREKLNKEIYLKIESTRFPIGKVCDYFYSPHVELSESTRKALRNEGFRATFCYSENHKITAADFVHPEHITIEKPFMMDANGETVYPENSEMYYPPMVLPHIVADAKGIVIHGMSAVVDVQYWADVHSLHAGSRHAVAKSLYSHMFQDIYFLINKNRISMPQISDVVDHARNRGLGTLTQLAGSGNTDTLLWNSGETKTSGFLSVLTVPTVKNADYWVLSPHEEKPHEGNSYFGFIPEIMDREKLLFSCKYDTELDRLYLLGLNYTAIEESAVLNEKKTVVQKENTLALTLPKGNYSLSLYSLTGRLIQQRTISSAGKNSASSISLDGMGKGVFIAQLNSENKSILTQKINVK